MADTASKEGDPRSKLLTYYFDAVKTIGTGNSAGLFGAGVALYYFSTRGQPVLQTIKVTAFVYLAGICCFAFAYFMLTLLAIQHHGAGDEPETSDVPATLVLAIISAFGGLFCWCIGTIAAAYVFWLL